MGPVEEVGKVAGGAVTALSSTPVMLALVLMQFITLMVVAWQGHERNIYEGKLNELLISICKNQQKSAQQLGVHSSEQC